MKKSYTGLIVLFFAMFTLLQTNAQTTELFENEATDSDSFSEGGFTFTSDNTNFDVTLFNNAGASTSDRFMDNFTDQGANKTYTLSLTSGATFFTLKSMDVYVSSEVDGANPTADGSITVTGRTGTTVVYTDVLNTGNTTFPTTFSPDNGFFNIDLSNLPTQGDKSNENIDNIQVSISGGFTYIAIDEFEFDSQVLNTDPPAVQSITLVGTPPSTSASVDFLVTFNENAFNVDAADFATDLVGTTGTISNVSGNGTTLITVTVSGITGDGTVSVDLIAGNNIEDDLGNGPASPFTPGEVFNASRCFEETFEGFSGNVGANTFTSNGTAYATSSPDFDITFFNNAGASGSYFLDNNADQGVNKVYSITTPGVDLFAVNTIDLFLSSEADGANPTDDGVVTMEGRLNGSTLYTITKNSGFLTTLGPEQGFNPIDFAADGASDFSSTNIDELRLTIAGSFIYIALDDFEHCPEVLTTNPPTVQNITLVGNPPAASTTVDFNVVFTEDAFNVTTDDFDLNLGGSTTGAIASIAGAGNSYTVTVNGISGEGAVRLDLFANTDIADTDGNTPPPPFVTGQSFLASLCNVETFEALALDANTWTNAGIDFNSSALFNIDEFVGAGAGSSDKYLDNLADQGTNKTYTIALTNATDVITMNQMAIYLSSEADGLNPTNDGSLTVLGRLDGATVYTITKTSGFPDTLSNGNNGFYELNFATEGGVDNSVSDIDEIVITIGGAFTYVAVDNFEFCTDPPPTAICMPFTVVLDASGNATILPADVDGGSTDNSGSVTLVSVVPNTFNCSSIGDNTVTLTVADSLGQQATCTAIVTVEDNIAPVITCPAPITQTNDPGVCGAVVNYAIPMIMDNCLNEDTPAIAGFSPLGFFEGSRFYISDTNFTGSNAFTDAIAQGGFVATVDNSAENQFLATALMNIGLGTAFIGFNDVAVEGTFEWQNGSASTFTSWEVGEPNNAGDEDYTRFVNNGLWFDVPDGATERYILELPPVGIIQTAGLASGSTFPVGTTTNTFSYTDGGNNTMTCSFDVTITDDEAPVIACLDFTVTLDANGEGTVSPVDLLGGTVEEVISLVGGDNQSGTIGNSDFTVPITTATSITFNYDYSTDDGPNFDELGYLLNGVYTLITSNETSNPSGSITVAVAASDVFGFRMITDDNTVGAGFATISDFSPGFTGQFEAPNWTLTNTNSDGSAVIEELDPVLDISENCGVDTVTLSQTAFNCSDAGVNEVIVTVTDVNGNVSMCTAMVTVPGNVATYTAGGWMPNAPGIGDTAIIEADYNTATDGGSIDACGCVVTNDAELTIAAGDYLSVQSDIEVAPSSKLTVAHQGSVVQVDDNALVTNDGAISVKIDTPNLDVLDFMIMGSPMDSETRESVWASACNVQNYTPENFNPLATVTDAYNFADAELDDWNLYVTGSLSAGEGFLVRPQDSYLGAGGVFNYDYTLGTLNNGVVTRPLNFNTTQLDSPNMLSNPYASAIDADLFLAANTEIDALYFWEHNTAPDPSFPGSSSTGQNYTMGDVSFYNAVGPMAAATGGAVPTAVISTAQGFGTFANAAGIATFNNSMRITGPNDTFRTNEVNKDRLWLKINSNTYSVGGSTLIGFLEGATANFESKYDSQRLATHVSIFSHIDATDDLGLAVQGREVFDDNMEVSLGFSSIIEEESSYTISLSNFDGAAWDSNTPYLIDSVTGTITNLKDKSYTFISNQGVFNNRFSLVFKDVSLGMTTNLLSDISMYPNPATNIINIVSPNNSISLIEVMDVRGRVVLLENVSLQNETSIDIASLDTAVYLVTITTDVGSITKRLIKK